MLMRRGRGMCEGGIISGRRRGAQGMVRTGCPVAEHNRVIHWKVDTADIRWVYVVGRFGRYTCWFEEFAHAVSGDWRSGVSWVVFDREAQSAGDKRYRG